MDKPESVRKTEAYVESIFGPGAGPAHVRFLDKIQHPGLREMLHGYHALEADTAELSLPENYLIGMCVCLAQGQEQTAAMFAKTLLHLGVRKEKLLEAGARLAMWIGGLPAVEASFVLQRAIREYEREGVASLGAWFPPERAEPGR